MSDYRVRERVHAELLRDLLHARGVTEQEDIERFLEPDFERDSHDPFLLPDMERAVERILAARERGEGVAVWSDYDCDGIPGGVLLTSVLRTLGLTVTHYIPHRHKEGYGLNVQGLDTLISAGVKLVITVDLGTSDNEAIEHAQSKGVDVIVTDHHVPPPELPPAYALINPKRADSAYPFDGLCGAGVAWKLVQALQQRTTMFPPGQEKWLLDLVGLATLSDMVPLRGENRMLARYGLLVMRRARRPGLSSLLKLLRISPATLTEDDVTFMVTPRINAASRMDSPELAAQLLATTHSEEGTTLAKALQALNDERKTLVASITKEANKRVAQLSSLPVIVMGSPSWRPGVLGLVANSLVEAHQKPVMLWGMEGGDTIRGSIRSEGTTNVVELMRAAGDALEHCGGHTGSGGFSVAREKIHELPERMAHAYATVAGVGGAARTIFLDRELELEEVPHARKDLMRLAPFGMENEKPLFMFPRVSLAQVRMFGKARNHLELTLTRGDARYAGISFFSTPESFKKPLVPGSTVDVVGHIESDWNGRPRLRVVDVL